MSARLPQVRIELGTADAGGGVCIVVEPGGPSGQTPAVETSLSALTIPTRYRPGIAQIGRLTDAAFADFAAALKKTSEADTSQQLASAIASDVPSIKSKPILRGMIESIAEMQSIQSTAHVEAQEFASDVWDALEVDSPDLAEGLNHEVFQSRIAELLETPIFLPAAKVKEVRREIERLLCGARILTDLRPAFPGDATKRPAMTIMHTLELTFHDDLGRHREFYVSLDDSDLDTLKHAIDRAVTKKQTLTKMLKNANFQLFD